MGSSCGEMNKWDIIDREKIKEILPHREPMLMVDQVERVGENEVLGIYTIQQESWFLQGHFPGNPVVPGVILCEIMAQPCCLLLTEKVKGKTPYLTGLNNVRFKRKVLPGDSIEIHCSLTKERHPFYFAGAKCFVCGELAASSEFSFALL